MDERLDDEPERWVQSCCVLCNNGCGLDVAVKEGKIVGVRGRADDRVNRGRLGPKGLHAWTLHLYGQNQRHLAWADTMIKENAAQAVVVPS